jgi:protein TonB
MAPDKPASYEHLLEPEDDTTRVIRLGFLAAVMIHLAVFAVTWPTLAQTEEVEANRIIVCRFPVVTYREPPPPEQRFKAPPRQVPIPDPDPMGPELIRSSEQETIPVVFPKEVLPFFPEAPLTDEESKEKIVVHSGIDVVPPKTLHRVQPQYTEAAIRIRFEGAVVLSLLIDTEGQVAEVHVVRGLPFGLTENAVAAARQWLFEPCIYNDKPVSVHMILTVRFNIAS